MSTDVNARSNGTSRARSQTIERANRVLAHLATCDAPTTATGVAAALSLDRTVTRRILETLADCELVNRHGSAYALGPAVLRLGAAYLDRLPVNRASLPYLLALQHALLRETPRVLGLFVPFRDEFVIIERFCSPGTPIDIFELGTASGSIRTAPGRTMLAYLPHETLVALLGDDQAESLAPRLDEIRERGGVDFSTPPYDPVVPGNLSIGVAIRDTSNTAVGALFVGGADLGPHLDMTSSITLQLRRAAESISAALS